jgi:hypothetical protein
MSEMIDSRLVATEPEVLAFCNRAREFGGAELLKALLPSDPSEPNSCLIARAMNFGCCVRPADFAEDHDIQASTFYQRTWVMVSDNAETLANAMGLRYSAEDKGMVLPPEIGNAAWAFDMRYAFRDYIR